MSPGMTAVGHTVVHHHNASEDIWLHIDPTGKWTTSGPISDGARDLLNLYLPLRTDPGLVIGQIGQSLDGRIATETGHSHYVTGPTDIQRLHRLRALVDAVIVGAGTVTADNPRLTVRAVDGPNPVRVVLDPSGRVQPDRAVFQDGAAETIVVRAVGGHQGAVTTGERLELPLETRDHRDHPSFAPAAVLGALRARGLRRILVEGGGITVSRFLQARVLTRLHVTVAPLLIGSGRHALDLPPIASLTQAWRPPCRVFHLGNDVLFDLDLQSDTRGS
ncbi:MAG: RibD family protein [Acidobacteriota bacterium]|nr:RibD family protein [Acidobacteriota bacterium]